MPHDKKQNTFLTLPPATKKAAGMASAQAGKCLSAYVADLIIEDASRRGLLDLVEPPKRQGRNDVE